MEKTGMVLGFLGSFIIISSTIWENSLIADISQYGQILFWGGILLWGISKTRKNSQNDK